MIEQTLINPNFVGRDAFRWFVGVVSRYVDEFPSSGVSGSEWGGAKARVRILGHHPGETSVVPDEELPWAHVLVPLTMGTGAGGAGMRGNIGEGSVVIGFFLDGDDAQQPIIIGALFSESNIQAPNSWRQGTENFQPFKQDISQIISNAFNKDKDTGVASANGGTPTPGGEVHNERGEVKESQGQVVGQVDTVVSIPSTCKTSNGIFSSIVAALRKFIKILNTIKQVGDNYINPVLNVIEDIPSILGEIATAIADSFSVYIKLIRDKIIEQIYKLLESVLSKLLPKDLKILKTIATDKAVDKIWCSFEAILQRLFDFIFDFLFRMIGNIINIPLCAAESFLGAIMNTIANEIEDAIGPILSEVASQLGSAVGSVMSFVNQVLGYASTALNFLDCESAECRTEYDLEMNKGYIPNTSIESFNSILNYSPAQGARNLLTDAENQFQQWLGSTGGRSNVPSEVSAAFGGCNSVRLQCGLPTVRFFGGNGSGANGITIVDAIGQVLGINILNPGSGYTTAPFVSIDDPCNIGRGARAEAVLGPSGGVNYVRIISPGSNYLGPKDTSESLGPQGPQGPQGTGPQGAQGPQGTGPQGAQGAQGAQGTGIQGAQGFGNTVTPVTTIGDGSLLVPQIGNQPGGVIPSNLVNDYINQVISGSDIGGPIEPCLINPLGEDGSEYVAFIQDVIILNTGIGYKETDLIYNIYCDSDVEIYPIVDDSGRIVDTRIVNPGSAIRVVPELRINTDNRSNDIFDSQQVGDSVGQGAVIIPILGFNKVRLPEVETDVRKIKKVILCAENHGS